MVFLDNHYLVLDTINEWGARLFLVSRKFVGRSLIPFSRTDYLLKSNRGANFNSYEYHFAEQFIYREKRLWKFVGIPP